MMTSWAQGTTTVSIDPASQEVCLGDTTTTDVMVEDVVDLYGAAFQISFDPTVVQVVQIQPGNFLSPDLILGSGADNVNGTIDYAICQLSPSLPQSGDGVLATITWSGKAAGTSPIHFTSVQLGAPGGVPIPAGTEDGQITVKEPDIEITKEADQTVVSGSSATFTIIVENTGDVDLTNVTVTDALAPDCDENIGSLPAGQSTSYTCVVANVTADFTNSATATGTDPTGGTVSDSDTAHVHVIHPDIQISKEADQTVISGSSATFTIIVENTGDVDLTNVTVTDALAPDCDNNIGNLPTGQSTSYTCVVANVTADFTNSATATGTDPTGGTVSDSDTAHVHVIHPDIQISKEADQMVLSGSSATFTIIVENTGDADLTNVTVTDALAPDCDNNIGNLPTGQSTSYTCVVANVTADFTNSATATGTDPTGGTVSDSDTAHVHVIRPDIQISKEADQTVVSGSSATFTIIVENTGDADLTNVTVTDALAPDCDNNIGNLPTGQSTSYTCVVANVTADFTNSATATGTDPTGGTVSDSDTAHVHVIHPDIQISKEADQTVISGSSATFTIIVENTGDVDLTNVTVTDALATDCDNNIGNLPTGQSTSYTCVVANVTADFTNSATATGTDPIGGTVSDSDTAHVHVIRPDIQISKEADQTVVSGSSATFTIIVENTGDADLTNVTVTDALAPDCDNNIGNLPTGQSTSYTCVVANVTADFTNSATATGTDPIGGTVSDSDSAHVHVIRPDIQISKEADQTVVSGSSATFTIAVENTGDVDLTNVTVTDALAPDCDNNIGSLPTGQSTSYTCVVANVTADFTNSATATGTDPTGGTVSDSDTAHVHVIHPDIQISKEADQTVISGSSATFTIIVENTGDVDLTNVTVTDALAPDCDNNIGNLPTGQSTSYTCVVANVTADFTNSATATGTDPTGGTVSDTDTADVDVIHPDIQISKEADQTVVSGSSATFTIIVENTGDADLTNVTVTDALAPDCDNNIGNLPTGQSTSYTCVVANVTADFTNSVTATGTDPTGGTVSDSDTAHVHVIHPDIQISKEADQTVLSGSSATFTIIVENTGDVDLTNVTVTDALAPDCDNNIGNLLTGQSTSYTCVVANVTADFTNNAMATGTDPIGGTVSDTDTADVDVIHPDVELTKEADPTVVNPGDTVDYTIQVENTGDSDLRNVMVDDHLPGCSLSGPSGDDGDGVLEPWETWTYSCSITAGDADIQNTATVQATDELGGTVNDSDTAFVNVIHPDIEFIKEAGPAVVNVGDTVDYTITVKSKGGSNLRDVTVDDDLPGCVLSGPSGDDSDGVLEPGETWTYTCAIVAGEDDIANTATVEATDDAGGTISDSDMAFVYVIHPDVELTKEADPTVVNIGDTVNYTITVENSGDANLTNVTVDDHLPGCALSGPTGDDGDGVLEPGETWVYTCSITAGEDDIENTATVEATDEAGGTVSDSDTASVDVIHPNVELTKEADPTVVYPGDTVDYTISVENTGDADLTNVTVDDDLPGCTLSGPSGDDGDGVLEPGETWTYTCSITAGNTDIHNTATVQATDEAGGTVGDSDTASVDVIHPDIELTKEANPTVVNPGDTVDYTISVENTGDANLTNVTVDDHLPGCTLSGPSGDDGDGVLEPGETWTYSCSITAGDTDIQNTATVQATDEVGGTVSDSDTATVQVKPLPTITSLSPVSATVGSPAFTLTVNGTNFVSGSVVQWGGSARTTTFVSGTRLTAAITASDIATVGTVNVTVVNPPPGGGTSNALPFEIAEMSPEPPSMYIYMPLIFSNSSPPRHTPHR